MASCTPDESAGRGSRVQHARVRMVGDPADRCRPDAQEARSHARARYSLFARRNKRGDGGRTRQVGNGRADCLPSGIGCCIQGVALMSSEVESVAGLVRGFMAGLLLVMFVGLWIWAFAAKRRKSFESASRLPLEEDRL